MKHETMQALHHALDLHPDLAEAIRNPHFGLDLQHDRDPLDGPDSEGREAMHRA